MEHSTNSEEDKDDVIKNLSKIISDLKLQIENSKSESCPEARPEIRSKIRPEIEIESSPPKLNSTMTPKMKPEVTAPVQKVDLWQRSHYTGKIQIFSVT